MADEHCPGKIWEQAAVYEVYEMNNLSCLATQKGSVHIEGHVKTPGEEKCTCGCWLEFGLPCKHACAYVRLKQKWDFVSITTRYVA